MSKNLTTLKRRLTEHYDVQKSSFIAIFSSCSYSYQFFTKRLQKAKNNIWAIPKKKVVQYTTVQKI